jgi:hypothetical protein
VQGCSDLLDDLVSDGEQPWQNGEAQQTGGVGIDDQFELRRLHHWQVRRLGALEDATGIGADLTIVIHHTRPVAQQPAGFGKFTQRVGPP